MYGCLQTETTLSAWDHTTGSRIRTAIRQTNTLRQATAQQLRLQTKERARLPCLRAQKRARLHRLLRQQNLQGELASESVSEPEPLAYYFMVICQAHADWLLSRIHMEHADVSLLISERSGEHRCSITYDFCTCMQVSQFSLLAIQQALECKTGSQICHQHTTTVSGKCWASSRRSVCCAEAWPAWQQWTSLLAAVGSAAACTRPALQRPSGALSMSSRLPKPSSTVSQLYIALAASADAYIIILWPEIMTVKPQWTSCLSLRQGFSDQTDVPDKSNGHVG